MAQFFGALSNVNTVAQQLLATANSTNGTLGVYVTNDPASPNTVVYGFTNAVTSPLALTNTINDGGANCIGYIIKPGQEVLISAKEFTQNLGVNGRVDPSLVYVISAALGQRVFWKLL